MPDTPINRARCNRCGEVVRCLDTHAEYVANPGVRSACSCGNLAVDGGTLYTRRMFGDAGYTELSEGFDAPYGCNGDPADLDRFVPPAPPPTEAE